MGLETAAERVNDENVNDERGWPARLDAVEAAPANHIVLMENDEVRVLETRIAPGERTPLHTHRWPFVMYVLSWSDIVRYDEQGNIALDTRLEQRAEPPRVVWTEPLPPHSALNVGDVDLHVISVETKTARS